MAPPEHHQYVIVETVEAPVRTFAGDTSGPPFSIPGPRVRDESGAGPGVGVQRL